MNTNSRRIFIAFVYFLHGIYDPFHANNSEESPCPDFPKRKKKRWIVGSTDLNRKGLRLKNNLKSHIFLSNNSALKLVELL